MKCLLLAWLLFFQTWYCVINTCCPAPIIVDVSAPSPAFYGWDNWFTSELYAFTCFKFSCCSQRRCKGSRAFAWQQGFIWYLKQLFRRVGFSINPPSPLYLLKPPPPPPLTAVPSPIWGWVWAWGDLFEPILNLVTDSVLLILSRNKYNWL